MAAVNKNRDFKNMTFKNCSYKSRGRYKEQLERRLEYFPAGNLYVLKSEDFFLTHNLNLRKYLTFWRWIRNFYGVGGYGIYQYLYLAREAVKHKPEYVILGLYPGNDIQPHACNSVNFAYYEKGS